MLNPRLFLLVLVLTGVLCSPVKGRPLPHENNTQDVYQAGEHSNVTLTLSAVNTTCDVVSIELNILNPRRSIYRYHNTAQPKPNNDPLKPRLQCDHQLDENGQIKCVWTDLRINDTGTYEGIVKVLGKAGDRRRITKLELKVVKAPIRPTQEAALKHSTPGKTSFKPQWERSWILIPVSLLFVVLLLVFLAIRYRKNKSRQFSQVPPSEQK